MEIEKVRKLSTSKILDIMANPPTDAHTTDWFDPFWRILNERQPFKSDNKELALLEEAITKLGILIQDLTEKLTTHRHYANGKAYQALNI